VAATVPGVEIDATLRNRRIALEFGDGIYEFMTESRLSDYLTRLGRKLSIGWSRDYRATRLAFNARVGDYDASGRAFLAERAAIQAAGASDDGRVRVSSRDLQDVEVVVRPGTIRAVPVDAFCAGVADAADRMIADYAAQVQALKMKFWG
jgi:hypothetical protein